MVFVIKRVAGFPQSVSIEPWAIPVHLKENDELKLVLHGLTSGSEVHLEHYKGESWYLFKRYLSCGCHH